MAAPRAPALMHRVGRLACGRLVGQRVTRLLPQAPRRLSTTPAPRTDGFNEALPRGDVVAPIVFGGLFAGAWYMAEEGRIKPLIDEIEPSTDPNAWPTPKQMFGHIWPFVASTLGMIFESVACKFSQTTDMAWLCTDAMNDDMKAAVALCLLVAPAEHSAAFVRTVNEHGTLRRIKEVVQIYKTLPREQHDDVMTNACVITAKVLPPVTTWDRGRHPTRHRLSPDARERESRAPHTCTLDLSRSRRCPSCAPTASGWTSSCG